MSFAGKLAGLSAKIAADSQASHNFVSEQWVDRAGSSYAAAAQRGQSSGARPSHGQQPNRQGFGSPDNMRTYKNKKGQSFQRNAHLVSWMVKKDPQPCWSCYTPGHQVKDCTASPARGNPPGYVPPQ
uniref:CCHC-type domain-containing protein n=1 Tax=Tetradesmus obliquus TaxID=3088 RepID=A0A383W218_TETOB|eukprot:jgi/Sobl393_1/725/SZX71152.1